MREDFKPPITVCAQLLKDQRHPCAYRGQRFSISRVDGDTAYGMLGCGHVVSLKLSDVELLEPLSKLDANKCKPVVQHKTEEKLVAKKEQTVDGAVSIPVFGYFAFMRELGEEYAAADAARVAAGQLQLDAAAFVPPEPDERTVISGVVQAAGRGLKSQKMTLNKVRAKSEDVRYDLVAPDPSDDSKRMVVGSICWSPDKGLTFPGLAPDNGVMSKACEAYTALKQTLTRKEWANQAREIFTGRWNGFAARNGGVVYWICPSSAEEVAAFSKLLLDVTGLGLALAPCVDQALAYSILLSGAKGEAESLDGRKMSPTLGKQTREALLQKIGAAMTNSAIPAAQPVVDLMASIQKTIDALPSEEDAPKPGRKKRVEGAAAAAAVAAAVEPVSAPTPSAPVPEPTPAPQPQAATPLPPPAAAPSLPPPPPPPVEARKPDAIVAIGGNAVPLFSEGAVADNMHAYSPANGFTAEDCGWTPLEGHTNVYYCWFSGKLYTSASLTP